MNRSRAASLILALAGAALLQGCYGHGNYTSAHANAAKEKMTAMKSALEWQTAHGAFLSGDLHKARKSVERSIALNEKVAKSHVLRGRILMEQGDLEGALLSLRAALEIEAENVDAYYYLGIANERLERREEALTNYTRAAELDSSSAQYHVAAAEMLMDMGRLDEAKVFLESRGPQLQNNAAVRQTLGHIAILQGDARTAMVLFREARLLAPNDPSVAEDLARAQAALGEWAEAEFTLSRLLVTPELIARRDLQKLRARCLVEVNRLVDAREILIRLTTGDEGRADTEAWIDLANVSLLLNDLGRVRTSFTTLLSIAPRRHEGYALRAIWLRKRGELAAAAESASSAVDLGGGAEAALLLAMIQHEMNNTEGARGTLSALLGADPANEAARRLLESMSGRTAVVDER
ncbi:MAG: tetratricopeptide repeat protein [Phycisphaeraceae bacterium]|nr:MAG: tetratricopeptide repeat protein [Phycisphaeraceae bacterium]